MNIVAKLLKERDLSLNVLKRNNHKPIIQTSDCIDCDNLQQHLDHKQELQDPSYKPVDGHPFPPPKPPPIFTENEKPSNIKDDPIEDDLSQSESEEDPIISEEESVIESETENDVESEVESEDNINEQVQQESESEEDEIMFL